MDPIFTKYTGAVINLKPDAIIPPGVHRETLVRLQTMAREGGVSLEEVNEIYEQIVSEANGIEPIVRRLEI